jgi:hypothetical protein
VRHKKENPPLERKAKCVRAPSFAGKVNHGAQKVDEGKAAIEVFVVLRVLRVVKGLQGVPVKRLYRGMNPSVSRDGSK